MQKGAMFSESVTKIYISTQGWHDNPQLARYNNPIDLERK